mgnify:CR=1 FL=1
MMVGKNKLSQFILHILLLKQHYNKTQVRTYRAKAFMEVRIYKAKAFMVQRAGIK